MVQLRWTNNLMQCCLCWAQLSLLTFPMAPSGVLRSYRSWVCGDRPLDWVPALGNKGVKFLVLPLSSCMIVRKSSNIAAPEFLSLKLGYKYIFDTSCIGAKQRQVIFGVVWHNQVAQPICSELI